MPGKPNTPFRKRLLIAFCILFTIALSFHIYGSIRLHRAEQRWIAAGGVTTFTALKPPDIPDEDNAAVCWEQAMELLPQCCLPTDNTLLKPWTAAPADLDTVINENAEAIKLALAATLRTQCVWHADWTVRHFNDEPILSTHGYVRSRVLTYLLVADAVRLTRRGDNAEAERRALCALQLAENVATFPTTLGTLVGISIENIVANTWIEEGSLHTEYLPQKTIDRLNAQHRLTWLTSGMIGDYAAWRDKFAHDPSEDLVLMRNLPGLHKVDLARFTDDCTATLAMMKIPFHELTGTSKETESKRGNPLMFISFGLGSLWTDSTVLISIRTTARSASISTILKLAAAIQSGVDIKSATETTDPYTGEPFRAERVGTGFVIWSPAAEPGHPLFPTRRGEAEPFIKLMSVQWATTDLPSALRPIVKLDAP